MTSLASLTLATDSYLWASWTPPFSSVLRVFLCLLSSLFSPFSFIPPPLNLAASVRPPVVAGWGLHCIWIPNTVFYACFGERAPTPSSSCSQSAEGSLSEATSDGKACKSVRGVSPAADTRGCLRVNKQQVEQSTGWARSWFYPKQLQNKSGEMRISPNLFILNDSACVAK